MRTSWSGIIAIALALALVASASPPLQPPPPPSPSVLVPAGSFLFATTFTTTTATLLRRPLSEVGRRRHQSLHIFGGGPLEASASAAAVAFAPGFFSAPENCFGVTNAHPRSSRGGGLRRSTRPPPPRRITVGGGCCAIIPPPRIPVPRATMVVTTDEKLSPPPPHASPLRYWVRRSTRMRRPTAGPASPTSVTALAAAASSSLDDEDRGTVGDRAEASSASKRPYAVLAAAAKVSTGRSARTAEVAGVGDAVSEKKATAAALEVDESSSNKSWSSSKSPRDSTVVVKNGSGGRAASSKAGGKRRSGAAGKKAKKKTANDDKDLLVLHSDDLAKVSPDNPWVDLEAPPCELRPSYTLTTGQSFHWTVVDTASSSPSSSSIDGGDDIAPTTTTSKSAWGTHDETEWVGPLRDRVVSIRETPTSTLCRVLAGPSDTPTLLREMRDYFQLDKPLRPLYDEWSSSCGRMGRVAKCLPGVRVMRQDPTECLISFICSSNNNIPRITMILARLRERYGTKLIDLPRRRRRCTTSDDDDDDDDDDDGAPPPPPPLALHAFPTLEQLSPATEAILREMGWGYRARYVVETRDHLLAEGGSSYLHSLRSSEDSTKVQEELLRCSGVGRKVADCIGLFSLDRTDAIPVDVHVSRIAERDYDPGGSVYAITEDEEDAEDGKKAKKKRKVVKSLTPTVYRRVGDLFRDRFGPYAGWAHSLLFAAELPGFRSALPDDVVAEMDRFREEERARKKSLGK